MKYLEDDYLMISGIQHFSYCPRQWALIHILNLWDSNIYTTKGDILHEKTDQPFLKESRPDKFITRAMPVSSSNLGVSGICDTIEYIKDKKGIIVKNKKGLWLPQIVEYKSGKSKQKISDQLQLCAQVLCLEEMLNVNINQAYLYYFKDNKRISIPINQNLRNTLKKTVQTMHDYYNSEYIPSVEYNKKKCDRCSLINICKPHIKTINIKKYMFEEE